MKIGTIKGIEIKLHFSTLVIVALVGYYAASLLYSLTPSVSIFILVVVGIINGVALLFSILIHELMHSILAQRYGLKVSEIELYLFGGVSKIQEEPRTAKSEIRISAIGPITSLILGAILLLTLFFLQITYAPLIVTLFYLGYSNIVLGIFNFLPAFPMDGGRVLRAYLWKKRDNLLSATKTASRVGVGFGYGLIIFGILSLFTTGISGMWLILIGWFLTSSAKQSYVQTVYEVTLSNFQAKEIAGVPKPAMPFNLLIGDAISQYFLRYKYQYFPVVEGDKLVGIVHAEDVKKIPVQKRGEMIVGYVSRKLSDFPTAYTDESGKEILSKLNNIKSGPHLAIVVQKNNNDIIGFIGEEELVNVMRFADIKGNTSFAHSVANS